jgi:DNA-binding transcriptional ArsR family regulator
MGGFTYFQVKLMFQKIMRMLEKIDSKLRLLSENMKSPQGPVQPIILSTASQTTLNALKTLNGSATATQVAAVTGRARAVESLHLNELYRNGAVLKRQQGRAKVFILKEAEQHA